MIKRYKITHARLGVSLILEIDHNELTNDLIKKQVEAKWHWEDSLAENENNYVMTFLKDVAAIIFIERARDKTGSLEEFIDEQLAITDDLHCFFDGSQGIRLCAIDDPQLDKHEDYTIWQC